MYHPVRQHPLLWRGLGRLSQVVFWRTDEGVCPYFVVLSSIENTDPNSLPLGAPPLRGGWVGFPDEGVCPYRLALSLIKETPSSL